MTGSSPVAAHRQRVVFIMGFPRCGSTLLAHLLGRVEGFFTAGEALDQLFSLRARVAPCGCGAPLPECAFWQRYAADIDPAAQRFVTRFLRIRHLHRLLWARHSPAPCSLEASFDAATGVFYGALARGNGAEFVVDSSKLPVYGLALARNPNLDVFTVHLVRDVRDVVASMARPKGYLETASMWRTTLWWSVLSVFGEWLRISDRVPGVRLRYEDLIEQPRATIAAIVAAATGAERDAGFLDDGWTTFDGQHLIGGNPDKLQRGAVPITLRRWGLSRWKRILVTCAAAPLLVWFRYPLTATGGDHPTEGVVASSER
jgi:hypothetical protein